MAGNRAITVTLRANVADFKSQFDAATRAVESTAKATEGAGKRADSAMGQMVQSARQNREAWTAAGTVLTGFGAAALGGLGLATKAAMDWESAWAGVKKTVDGSPEQMASLEAGLRGLARELPATHTEIAAVAEAAGQLGIETPNILGFTRTMINLGESTNLSAEQAATALARFSNITGTSQQDIGKLGASIVGLGNNFATTESEIVDMAMRLAGAGTQAGLTEGDILGMATAMSSVGIEAEAGGTAMSQTMKRIGKAVDEGGDKLDLFASVSGMSADQFVTAWRDDPAAALTSFVTGLSNTEAQGMSTNAVLTELGITGIRESDALLRLSSASEVMADAMATGNEEFVKGTALIEEASKRYETAESRVKIARNALVDAGISIGSAVLPPLAILADRVADVAGWFADLPQPVHSAVAGLTGVAGVTATAAGGFLLLFPRILDTVEAFRTLKASNSGLASGLGKVGRAAGVAAAAFVVLSAADGIAEMFDKDVKAANYMASELGNMAATTGVTADSLNELVSATGTSNVEITGFGDALDSVNVNGFLKALDFVGSGFGAFDSDVGLAKESITNLDQALTLMLQSGATDQFVASLDAATASAKEYGYSFEDMLEQMPALKSALTEQATAMGVEATATNLAKIAHGELTPVVDETTGAVTGYTEGMEDAAGATQDAAEAATDAADNLVSLGKAFLATRDAARDYADAQKDASKAASENGKHWGESTKAGRELEEAIDGMASAALDEISALNENGEATGQVMQQKRDDLIKTAMQMGASREEAKAYVDQLGLTPESISTQVDYDDEAALEKWNDLYSKLWPDGGHPPMSIEVDADTDPADTSVEHFKGAVTDGPPANAQVDADTDPADASVEKFRGAVGDGAPANAKVDADTTSAQQKAYGFKETVEGSTSTAPVDADTSMAQSALLTQLQEVENSGGSITIDGNPVSAEQALFQIMAQADGSTGTMSIDGNNSPALGELNGTVTVINNADGTVTIKGNNDPAESALSTVKNAIDAAAGIIDIQGDNSKAKAATDAAKSKADNTSGTMGIKGNNSAAQNSLSNVLGSVNRSHGTMGINGNASGARNATQGAVGYANRSRGSIKVSALTGAANSAISNAARNRTAYIHVVASGVSAAIGVISRAVNHRAAGGPISGPGTGTSDSIPAMLSNGEHVWTAAEVAALGGHQAMYSLRARALAGERFAVGGAVDDPLPYRQQARNWAPEPSMTASTASSSTVQNFYGRGLNEKELAKNWRTEQAREAAVKTRHRRF